MAYPFSHFFPLSLSLTTKSSSQVSITVHIFFFLLHHLFGLSSSTFNKSAISLSLSIDDSYLFSLYDKPSRGAQSGPSKNMKEEREREGKFQPCEREQHKKKRRETIKIGPMNNIL
jgi:hypothetical protein